jgi:hypothetical protein
MKESKASEVIKKKLISRKLTGNETEICGNKINSSQGIVELLNSYFFETPETDKTKW